jgi:hypothetical protein
MQAKFVRDVDGIILYNIKIAVVAIPVHFVSVPFIPFCMFNAQDLTFKVSTKIHKP